ncbi:irregular chiasm C-roughest protein-like isoform X2 [Anopheles darlingi]|uniref:irregular chiasm C-roughest protein-like isoform X2 n=1 Tax=Anopheles darlingi TaxID=43151 RepID=UPI0021002389|nr:irregular chiasm C-roughest protein-like isoform X2 [Anopheles darlingi]
MQKLVVVKKYAAGCWNFILYIILLLYGGNDAKMSNNTDRTVYQHFAMEPQDQTAIVGSRVTLPCRVENKSGQLQWTKDDFGLGTLRNLSGFERYMMIGSDEEGDYSLDISPVMLDDDAKYQCQVGPGKDGTPGIRSRFAKLSVLVPPEAPKIVQGDFLMTTEDREIELECVSVGGKPAAEIIWIDGHGNVVTGGIEYVREPLQDARRFTAKSILKLTPKREYHNTTFTCQAQNTADRSYRSVRLQLEVKYAPKVRIFVVDGVLNNARLTEGTELRLSCRADANPPELNFQWFVGDELAEENHASELIISNVSRKYHDTIIRCVVQNAVGKSEESVSLDICYGPTFRELPKSIEADIDTKVTLQCDVDGNPTPDITWLHESTKQIVASGPNVTLAVTSSTAGKYLCKASVQGFPIIEAEATVFLRGPPLIRSPRQQYGTLSDRGQLECKAFAVPRPKYISWSFNGYEINASQPEPGDYTVMEDLLSDGIRSILIIASCLQKHFGSYNCTVANDYGIDFVEIDFLSKESKNVSVIFLGAIGGITFLIFVFVIGICICSRRIKMKHLPPADVIPKYDVQEREYIHHRNTADNRNDMQEVDREAMAVNLKFSIRSIESPCAVSQTSSSVAPKIDSSNYSDMSNSLSILQCKPSESSNGYMPYVHHLRDLNSTVPPLLQSFNTNNVDNSSVFVQQSPTDTMTIVRNFATSDNCVDMPILQNIKSSVSSIPRVLMNHPVAGCHFGLESRFLNDFSNHGQGGSGTFSSPPATANPAATPAPPPYATIRNQTCLLAQGLQSQKPSESTITGTDNALSSALNNPSSPTCSQSGSIASTQSSQAAPINFGQLQPLHNSGQFILPNIGPTKLGVLATHV